MGKGGVKYKKMATQFLLLPKFTYLSYILFDKIFIIWNILIKKGIIGNEN